MGGGLLDLDRVDQNPTNLGTISGSVNIDMTKSNVYATLGGDVTSVTLTNNPTSVKYTTSIIAITQDATTARGIDWSGSGIVGTKGATAGGLEPDQTLGSVTEYWLYWSGHLGYWRFAKVETSTSAL